MAAGAPELDLRPYWTGEGEPNGPILQMKEGATPRTELERLFFSLDPFRIVGETQHFMVVSSQHWMEGEDVIYRYQLRPLKHPPTSSVT